jgi:hypothetical protein
MPMLTAKTIAGGALLMVLAASTTSAQVQLSIRDGRVTLVATNATVRQILSEWARIGQTKIVNVERIPGGPLTLQFTGVPEAEALDILLRAVTGYLAAPRAVPVANLSHYDRILVLATAATPRVPAAAGPTPVIQRPQLPQPTPEADDDVPSIVQPPRGPLFPTFQLPQAGNPQPGGASATPGAIPPQPPPPFGVDQRGVTGGIPPTGLPASGPFVVSPGGSSVGTPRPGMVVPPPAQPGVFPQGQPGQPVPSPDN